MLCTITATDCPLCTGVAAVMFAAVITHCSNGVYDKARHYRAAECLSKLGILSQTVRKQVNGYLAALEWSGL